MSELWSVLTFDYGVIVGLLTWLGLWFVVGVITATCFIAFIRVGRRSWYD